MGKNNTGDWNSGSGNSGNWNSGDRNSGDWNSGSWNSGNRNSGSWNSGYGNSCDRSSGIFCSEQPQLLVFNKPTAKTWNEIEHPSFDEFYLTKWIPESEMTNEEKKAEPEFHTRKGYLKRYSWEEAWSNYWRDTTKEDRQRVLNLPNFDAEIFKDITGIDVNVNQSCNGKVVEIDGKKYKLQEV